MVSLRLSVVAAIFAIVACQEYQHKYGASSGSYANEGESYADEAVETKSGKAGQGISAFQQFDFSLGISSPIVVDLDAFTGRRRRSIDDEPWDLDEKRSHSLAKIEAVISTLSNNSDYICNEFVICHMMKDLETYQPFGVMVAKLLFGENKDADPIGNATYISPLGRWRRYVSAAKRGLDANAECEVTYPSCSESVKEFGSSPTFSVLRFLASFIGLNIIT